MSQLTNIKETFSEKKIKQYDAYNEFNSINMVNKRNDLISQFEINLQQTFEILNKQQKILEKDRDCNVTHETIGGSNTTLIDIESFRGDTKKLCFKYSLTPDFKDEYSTQRNSESQREKTLQKSSDDSKQLADTKKSSRLFSDDSFRYSVFDKLNSGESAENLKGKLNNLNEENDKLRNDIVKIKTDSFRKYEILQKNNDDLLISYENKVINFLF